MFDTKNRTYLTRRTFSIAAILVLVLFLITALVMYRHSKSQDCGDYQKGRACIAHNAAAVFDDDRPTAAEVSGGEEIIISGSNFAPDIKVRFGETPAQKVIVLSPNRLVATTRPVTTPGPADISLIQNGHTTLTPKSFRYEGPFEITAISPDRGPRSGGQKVKITGNGFARDSSVNFQGAFAEDMKYIDQHTLIITTAPHEPGVVDVSIVNEDEEALAEAAYTYDQ